MKRACSATSVPDGKELSGHSIQKKVHTYLLQPSEETYGGDTETQASGQAVSSLFHLGHEVIT